LLQCPFCRGEVFRGNWSREVESSFNHGFLTFLLSLFLAGICRYRPGAIASVCPMRPIGRSSRRLERDGICSLVSLSFLCLSPLARDKSLYQIFWFGGPDLERALEGVFLFLGFNRLDFRWSIGDQPWRSGGIFKEGAFFSGSGVYNFGVISFPRRYLRCFLPAGKTTLSIALPLGGLGQN